MVNYENPVTTPAPSQTLALSQAPMLGDFQYLKAFGGKDHNFSSNSVTATDGYHTLVHMQEQALPGSPIASIGQLFVNSANVPGSVKGTQLWYEDSFGIQTAITSAAGSNPAAKGHSFLPGNIIINWGSDNVSNSGTATPITFEKTFSSNPWSISVGVVNTQGNSPSANNVYIKSGTIGTGGFTVTNSSSGGISSIYWMAIGPN